MSDAPLIDPLPGFPAALVPYAPRGVRRWDKDGPADEAPLPPVFSWAIWRREGVRLICVMRRAADE